ncbi:hypothetical protein ACP4OV_000437 [Aristida adscensionis]
MAAEVVSAPAPALPPRASAASSSSLPTVGVLLTRASAAAAAGGGGGGGAGAARECSSPRSLLSRILHRGRGRAGGGGFGCRLRLPRYCSSGAGTKEDAVASAAAAAAKEEDEAAAAAAAPKVVCGRAEPRESPRSSSSLAGRKPATAEDALPASLGLGASLVLLLSRSAAELSRMAELRAQMERLLLDARADVRSCDGRPSASGDRTESASVVKGPIACAGADEGSASPQSRGSSTPAAAASRDGSEGAGRRAMEQMEAELEAELTRLQLGTNDDGELVSLRRRRDRQLETEAKSGGSSSAHSVICSDDDAGGGGGGVIGQDGDECQDDGNDGGVTDQDADECQDDEEEDDDDDEEEEDVEAGGNGTSPSHGGVSARELERRLHELLQSRHEARIAELESALERARRKLLDAEREACRWRDTAKLATRFTDESRLR